MVFTVSNVRALRSLVADQIVGSDDKNYLLVEVQGTSTDTADTYDIADAIPSATAIVGPVTETVDAAVSATANTWSGTTVTFASHTGSGIQRNIFIVEV